MSYEGLQAEVVQFKGHNGDTGEAYYARPTRAGKFPGIVVVMHLPGGKHLCLGIETSKQLKPGDPACAADLADLSLTSCLRKPLLTSG